LEKTSKIIKFGRQPNTPMPAKPRPEVPPLHVFWTPPGVGTPPLPWAAWSSAWPWFYDSTILFYTSTIPVCPSPQVGGSLSASLWTKLGPVHAAQ